jgi:hypothetical protein
MGNAYEIDLLAISASLIFFLYFVGITHPILGCEARF